MHSRVAENGEVASMHNGNGGEVSTHSGVTENGGEAKQDAKNEANSKFTLNWRSMWIFFCLWTAYFLTCLAYSIMNPFFPQEAEERGTPSFLTGLIIGMGPLTVVVVSPIFGCILPHMGISLMASIGLLLVGLSYVSLGFLNLASSAWLFSGLFLLVRTIEGIGTAMFQTASLALIPDLYPKSVATLTGLLEMSGGLGYALGYSLGGILYELGGYQLPFLVTGGSILLFWFPCSISVWKMKKKNVRKQTLPFRTILKLSTNFTIVVLILVYIIATLSFTIYIPSLAPYVIQKFNIGTVEISLIYFSESFGYLLFSIIIGPVSDKLGKNRIICIVGLVTISICAFLIGSLGSEILWVLFVTVFVSGIGTALSIVPVYDDLIKVTEGKYIKDNVKKEEIVSFISGVVSSATNFGLFVGPFAGGILYTFSSFPTIMIFLGEILLSQALLLAGVSIINNYIQRRKK